MATQLNRRSKRPHLPGGSRRDSIGKTPEPEAGWLRFRAVIRILGINPYVHVSAARVSAIRKGWRKPLPVLVRVNGEPKSAWRINLVPVGDGSFYLYLHGSVRKASQTKTGDRVTIDLAFDSSYRNGPMHPLPRWFATELAVNSGAGKAWKALAPSRKKEVLRYFASLKSLEARARNLKKVIRVLSGIEDRFLGRTWKNGK